MSAEWVRTYEDGADWSESIGGVMWNDAPLPRWWHRCRAQTRAQLGMGYAERCACGAASLTPAGPWLGRNQTRKARARVRREARRPRVQVTCGECGNPYEAAARTPEAAQRLCNGCWAEVFTAGGGERH